MSTVAQFRTYTLSLTAAVVVAGCSVHDDDIKVQRAQVGSQTCETNIGLLKNPGLGDGERFLFDPQSLPAPQADAKGNVPCRVVATTIAGYTTTQQELFNAGVQILGTIGGAAAGAWVESAILKGSSGYGSGSGGANASAEVGANIAGATTSTVTATTVQQIFKSNSSQHGRVTLQRPDGSHGDYDIVKADDGRVFAKGQNHYHEVTRFNPDQDRQGAYVDQRGRPYGFHRVADEGKDHDQEMGTNSKQPSRDQSGMPKNGWDQGNQRPTGDQSGYGKSSDMNKGGEMPGGPHGGQQTYPAGHGGPGGGSDNKGDNYGCQGAQGCRDLSWQQLNFELSTGAKRSVLALTQRSVAQLLAAPT